MAAGCGGVLWVDHLRNCDSQLRAELSYLPACGRPPAFGGSGTTALLLLHYLCGDSESTEPSVSTGRESLIVRVVPDYRKESGVFASLHQIASLLKIVFIAKSVQASSSRF
eukprot:scaffold88152_cov44-Prasinocladus_malaysianus.AAC.1